jgi:signal-transduction protein with cAMP-binding, CBS, and nucleotidyltransferase domain
LLRGIQEQAKRPVSDVMRPIEAILQADDHYMKAMYEMVSGNLSLIPVIQDEQLVGVLRSVDLFHEMAKLVR